MTTSETTTNAPNDYFIVCRKGVRVPCNRARMEAEWPMFNDLVKVEGSNRGLNFPFPAAWVRIMVAVLSGSTEMSIACGEARGVCFLAALFQMPKLLDLAVMVVGEMLKIHVAQGHDVPEEAFERENIISMCIRDVREGTGCCADEED